MWTKEESFQLFKKFAEEGEVAAQSCLGLFYSYGEGVEQDWDEAIKWFEKAAKQGDAEAQYQLGEFYFDVFDSLKKPKTNRTAVKWFRKAAEQGHKYAQEMLGDAYYWGKGVKQNYKESFVWYMKAAKQGVVSAMKQVGDMYYGYSDKGILERSIQ